MNTATLVRASADIVTVTTLRVGDVYQRLEKAYNGEYINRFGVVQTVAYNGEDALITTLEFRVGYKVVEPELKTFGTDTDLKLFAATPDEVRAHFAEVRKASAAAIKEAEDALAKAKAAAAVLASTIRKQSTLTAAETVVGIEQPHGADTTPALNASEVPW